MQAERARKVTEVRTLRDRGLKLREIAELTAIPISTVGSYLADPDGEKLRSRKKDYQGVCRTCGSATNGSRGPGRAPDTCRNCELESQKADWPTIQREWENGTPVKTIAAMTGRSRDGIEKLAQRIGLSRRRLPASKARDERVRRLCKAGASVAEIQAQCGFKSYGSAYNATKRLGPR